MKESRSTAFTIGEAAHIAEIIRTQRPNQYIACSSGIDHISAYVAVYGPMRDYPPTHILRTWLDWEGFKHHHEWAR